MRAAWIALGLVVASSGCGGIGPGDYKVYRVAFEQTQREADCFDAGMVPVDEQDDTSNLYASGTFVLYVGADETFYLDTGTATLRGVENGAEDFTFSGNATDVEVEGDEMDPTTTTTVTDLQITFTIEGQVGQGSVRQAQTFNCTGPMCPDPSSTSCTSNTNFIAGEVEDVELQHEI